MDFGTMFLTFIISLCLSLVVFLQVIDGIKKAP